MKLSLLTFFLAPYKKLYAGLIVVMAVGGTLDGVSLAAFLPLLTTLAEPADAEAGGGGVLRTAGRLLSISDPVIAAAVLLIGVFTVKVAVAMLREWLVARAGRRHLYDLKNSMLKSYARQPYQFFLDNKQGHLIYKALNSPSRLTGLLVKLPQLVAELLKIVAIVVVMIFVFPLGTAVIVVVGLGYYQLIRYLSRKVSYVIGRERVHATEDEHAIANEFLNGVRQIMIFRAVESWLDRLRAKIRTVAALNAKDVVWMSFPRHLMELAAVTLFLVFLMVLRMQGQATLTQILPQLGVFAVGLVQLLPALTGVGRMRMEIVGFLPDAELIYRALNEAVPEREHGKREIVAFERDVVFEDVWFTYAEREPVLKGVKFAVEKGKTTALVGASGAGKSTIVNLILRLYEPTAGTIRCDGVPLDAFDRSSWLGRIGYVSQEPFVFHATVADNIRFGRNSYSMVDVVAAAKMANAHDFIAVLPQDYDTLVGERGMKLSGGQQQRLCIARALLASPDILIFDEATSSLDSASEALIQKTLTMLSRDHTLLVIAHRQSTVASADKIIVLDGGHVVQHGSPDELLKDTGQYAMLFGPSRQ